MQGKRNGSLDLIRIVALFCVVSVHFLWNSGYYNEVVFGKRMYVMTLMYAVFMICVPLFIILTGYLMCNKQWNLGYYLGIKRTAGIYVLASIVCIVFKKYILGMDYSIGSSVLGILDFSGANYAWYVEMYLGLFILIPFLNLIYANLQKQGKIALLFSLLFLTALPSVINNYNLGGGNIRDVFLTITKRNKIIPNFWVSI